MIVAIDFDGTIVEHEFPNIGKPVPHALRVMKRLIANGHQIILWTMRSDSEDETYLTEAVLYLSEGDIKLFGSNSNPDQDWSTSPKAYAQVYIDDAALGCPLIRDDELSLRPYVDWVKVEQELFIQGYLHKI